MKPRAFLTRTIPSAGLDLIKNVCEVDLWEDELPPSSDVILEMIKGVDGLVCLLTDRIDAKVLDCAGQGLKVVSSFAVGVDNIDIDAATARSIPVGNTPGVLTETTADLAFALLLAAARRIVEGADQARAGKWRTWSPTGLLGRDAYGATLGIVGMGRIGRAVARRASGFDMKVIYFNPGSKGSDRICGARVVEFEQLIAESDFISVHVPLTAKTHRMFDRETLKRMKPTAVLINTARGPVIDHDALYEALDRGWIGYAALDVTDPEPLPADHPLYGMPNCLIVPHVGSASVATRDKMAVMAAQNLIAGVKGKRLPNCVNPEVYD